VNGGANGNGKDLGNPGQNGSISIISWESYSDSGHTIQSDSFTPAGTVYLKATGLNSSYRWDVAYYQGDNSLYNITRNQTLTSGYLNLSIVPNGTGGTWHSIIYVNSTFWNNVNPGSYYIPQSYTESDTNMSGFDSFAVTTIYDSRDTSRRYLNSNCHE